MTDASDHDIASFALHVLGKPLYPYQQDIAQAILASIEAAHGHIFTVMMARQMGKNQLSAIIEAYLLMSKQHGTIVKAAPTSKPQLSISRQRLLTLLNTPITRDRLWTSEGLMIGLAPQANPAFLRTHTGPRVSFYSAAPDSNVVGATADLLLEIDEAQDVSPDKFDRDFRPMASTTNATTVLYGTAWSDHTLLAHQRATNLQLQQHTGDRLHFEYDWRTLAALNPTYRRFVEQEIVRLGEDHPVIQTQYLLRPISGAGSLFTSMQHTLLQGHHPWESAPLDDSWYIAGMDVAGEARPASLTDTRHTTGRSRRDSTVITIGRVHHNALNLPCIEVVHHQWWTGMPYMDQYAATVALVQHWNIRTLVIDATGLGSVLASLLRDRLGDFRIRPFTFTRPNKSHLAYQLLAFLNSGRLTLYSPNQAPTILSHECWHQLQHARQRVPAPDILDFYVDPSDGHDDFLISLALLVEALKDSSPPPASVIVTPREPRNPYRGRYY